MKNLVKYKVTLNEVGETQVVFEAHKSCSCGVHYTTWGSVKENKDGYWFDCPICLSTNLVRK